MFNPGTINQISEKISQLLPPGAQQLKADVDKKIRAVLQNQLAQLDFVSREEFDIQTRVLQRTRAKLETLEEKIKILEEKIS